MHYFTEYASDIPSAIWCCDTINTVVEVSERASALYSIAKKTEYHCEPLQTGGQFPVPTTWKAIVQPSVMTFVECPTLDPADLVLFTKMH